MAEDRRPRKIGLPRTPQELQGELESYRRAALDAGADDARVIDASLVRIDERVTLKCQVPLCFGFGTSANCPPHAPSPERMRQVLGLYERAVLFKLDVPPAVMARNRDTILERAGAYRKVFDIASAVESAAFYDGHYLAVGFAAGSCKSTYCYEAECAALKGERCRHELRSRPSMEAVGIDVYRLATGVGWDIYPIGSGCTAGEIPGGMLVGLVLIQ